MNTPIRIVLADDHPLFLHGLASILREEEKLHLLGLAANGEELLQLVEQHRPDIAIVDIEMPALDGIEATRLIKKLHPATGVIALTIHREDYTIIDMFAAGAEGYLLKTAGRSELLAAAEAVHSGHTYYSNTTSQRLKELIADNLQHPRTLDKTSPLTPRERTIIELLCREFTNKQIAGELHLSIKTVENYRKVILEKIDAQNLAGIVTYAIRTGIYKP